jgi:glycosidase
MDDFMMNKPKLARMEFHISRLARDRYQFDQTLFAQSGNVIFANFHAARLFAQKMNSRRDLVRFPEQAIRAGQVNAMGLIDEIMHFVVGQYRQQRNPEVMGEALAWLYDEHGQAAVEAALRQFVDEFPPISVYLRQESLDEYLEGESRLATGEVVSNRQIVLEELLMLWLENVNPAFSPYLELFEDANLEKHSAYLELVASLKRFLDTQPPFGPDYQNLVDMLRSPAIAVPHSLNGQLEYIRSRWGLLLGKFLYRLLSSLDLIKEEEKAIFGVGGQGPARVIDFIGLEVEAERFSPDRDWMPNLVLLAKNSYVWLDQLSKKYRRPITRLDEIPDEELDTLSRWGFTSLWLIGLWERSLASRTIKQLRGNQDAVASAYSLFGYDIAADLGGDEAYTNLRDRAWKRGIRLASDMVPNHMGIDSRWVIEHPDWFISLDYSPFPSYTFNGPNLSWDCRVGIFLEDHYYNNTDAAVVFKRVDFFTGSERYIYHGNDGTSMPWNDTAQLDYLKSEVREAVIQTILHVARKFPVIRFDAAMTLAKKHYQRLWYPEPGTGGDIPSRAEHGLTKEQFDAAFPEEFWREVVDRVAQEVPDTLLLAEAFWLMEGYFVRTLGMHRVYNSAFMNMLRDEKNQEYRLVIKNTLEFEPEILKRYVNFMNNPDERTAVEQFGKGDKYFGVCTVMATMPGLPMIGHGQVEGYTEKYGMEFRRAYWDERPDGYLVERHEREIFPLLRKRYLFAEAKDFLLYDFFTTDGYVNEDVFAYSNKAGSERSLVLYHNKFSTVRGWIRTSVAFSVKDGDERKLLQKSLGEGLGLSTDPEAFVIFRDQVSGMEFIRSCQEIHSRGLYAELEAYKYQVFLDFREVQDNQQRQYAQLAEYLSGRGVPNVDEAVKEIFLQPVHTPFRELVNAGSIQWLIDNRWQPRKPGADPAPPDTLEMALSEAEQKMLAVLVQAKALTGGTGDPVALAQETHQELAALLALPAIGKRFDKPASTLWQEAVRFLKSPPVRMLSDGPTADGQTTDGSTGQDLLAAGDSAVWGALLGWVFTHNLGRILTAPGAEPETNPGEISRAWLDEWLLGKLIAAALQEMGLGADAAWRAVGLTRVLTGCQGWCSDQAPTAELAYRSLENWLKDTQVQQFLGVNRYQGILWFNQEAFDELLWWLFVLAVVESGAPALQPEPAGAGSELEDRPPIEPVAIEACFELVLRLRQAAAESGYQVERLLEVARD